MFAEGPYGTFTEERRTLRKVLFIAGGIGITPLRALMTTMDRQVIDKDNNFVPNGIAYSPASGKFAITGKYWPMLYTGRFLEAN